MENLKENSEDNQIRDKSEEKSEEDYMRLIQKRKKYFGKKQLFLY